MTGFLIALAGELVFGAGVVYVGWRLTLPQHPFARVRAPRVAYLPSAGPDHRGMV